MRSKLCNPLHKHIKQLSEKEQPSNVEEMYDVMQHWADGERISHQGSSRRHNRWERMQENKEWHRQQQVNLAWNGWPPKGGQGTGKGNSSLMTDLIAGMVPTLFNQKGYSQAAQGQNRKGDPTRKGDKAAGSGKGVKGHAPVSVLQWHQVALCGQEAV